MAGRTATIFQAVSKVCADASSAKVVLGVDLGTSGSPLVRPIGDTIPGTPAIFLVPGDWSIISGSARRDTYELRGAIYVPRENPEAGVVVLLDLFDQLVDALYAHSKAYGPNNQLQSVLPTEGPGLSDAEWPEESNAWYLTWPFSLEVKVNVAAFPQAQ
jgi:hypothetical protein